MSLPTSFDPRDYGGTIQAAIDACAASLRGGGIVHVPPGAWVLNSGLVFADNPSPNLIPQITLAGDGINVTTIYTNTPNVDLVTIARSNVHLKGIYFQGSQQSAGTGRGIVISNPINGRVLNGIHMEDIQVAATEREALFVPDGFPHDVSRPRFDGISILCTYDRCWFDSNLAPAAQLVYLGAWNTLHRFTHCNFTNFKGRAVRIAGMDTVSMRECLFEAGDNASDWVVAAGSMAGSLDRCYFEDHGEATAPTYFVRIGAQSHGWDVNRCTFRRHAGTDPKAVRVTGGSRDVTVNRPHVLTLGGIPNAPAVVIDGAGTQCEVIGGIAQGPTLAEYAGIEVRNRAT